MEIGNGLMIFVTLKLCLNTLKCFNKINLLDIMVMQYQQARIFNPVLIQPPTILKVDKFIPQHLSEHIVNLLRRIVYQFIINEVDFKRNFSKTDEQRKEISI